MYKDKSRQKKAVKEYRQRKWNKVREIKTSRGCALCGYNLHPDALQFHHRGDKDDTISNLLAAHKGMDKIMEEIDKCVVLCANCHAVIHANL